MVWILHKVFFVSNTTLIQFHVLFICKLLNKTIKIKMIKYLKIINVKITEIKGALVYRENFTENTNLFRCSRVPNTRVVSIDEGTLWFGFAGHGEICKIEDLQARVNCTRTHKSQTSVLRDVIESSTQNRHWRHCYARVRVRRLDYKINDVVVRRGRKT